MQPEYKARQAFDCLASPQPQQQLSAAIRSWAAHVHPGSPAPLSPHRRPSLSGSVARSRRPSCASAADENDNAVDLAALGYTAVFVRLPHTPSTPSPVLRAYARRHGRVYVPKREPREMATATATVTATVTLDPAPKTRPFRSLGILRQRNANKAKADAPEPTTLPTTAKPTPAKPTPTPKNPARAPSHSTTKTTASASTPKTSAASVAQRKRTLYTFASTGTARPPPLAAELALMQFTDGGSIDVHARRVMAARAKEAAGSRAGAAGGDPHMHMHMEPMHKDAQGRLWWDEHEEMEYAHLLSGSHSHSHSLSLSTTSTSTTSSTTSTTTTASTSSRDSDLDPAYLLPLPDVPSEFQSYDCGASSSFYTTPEDRALTRRNWAQGGGGAFAVPARASRPVRHMRKGCAFPEGPAPVGGTTAAPGQGQGERPRGAARRRPAPLALAGSTSNPTAAASTTGGIVVQRAEARAKGQRRMPVPGDAQEKEEYRREFLAASFAPAPVGGPALSRGYTPATARTVVDTDARIPLQEDTGRETVPRETAKRAGVRAFFGLGVKVKVHARGD